MARYGKTKMVVVNLIHKARVKGHAVVRRGGVEVWSAVFTEDGFFKLNHYGTMVLKLSVAHSTIVDYYGISASDRDALNTTLDAMNVDSSYYFTLSGQTVHMQKRT